MTEQAEPQLAALLALVDEHRARECGAIHAAAREQAAEVITQTYRAARGRLHQAVIAERRRMEAQVESARVQLETRERERKRQATAALLAEAWTLLSQRVRARWHDPAARRVWLETLTGDAVRALPHRRWLVHHPPGWETNERDWLARRIESATGHAPTFSADPNILAGVRLEIEGAMLDGTLDGILSDHREIEAQLLAEAEKR